MSQQTPSHSPLDLTYPLHHVAGWSQWQGCVLLPRAPSCFLVGNWGNGGWVHSSKTSRTSLCFAGAPQNPWGNSLCWLVLEEMGDMFQKWRCSCWALSQKLWDWVQKRKHCLPISFIGDMDDIMREVYILPRTIHVPDQFQCNAGKEAIWGSDTHHDQKKYAGKL